LLKEEMK